MSYASFVVDGRVTFGVGEDGAIREASDGFRARFVDLQSVLEAGALQELASDSGGSRWAIGDVRFLPTIPNPRKILCIGANYRPHVEEMGRSVPDYPMMFTRFSNSLVGHGEPLLKPFASKQFDFEGEIAVVIGRAARHVSRDEALEYIAGYCPFMDGSIRDWQKHTSQFTGGKNFFHSGSMGPYLVAAEEIPDPTTLEITTRIDGEVMQQGSMADLIFDVPALIEYCSTFTELLPGDVLATGTPEGVGAARTPPRWLNDGDRLEIEVCGMPILSNPVHDERAAR